MRRDDRCIIHLRVRASWPLHAGLSLYDADVAVGPICGRHKARVRALLVWGCAIIAGQMGSLQLHDTSLGLYKRESIVSLSLARV